MEATKKHEGRRRRSLAEVLDHLAASYEVTPDGCWLWTGPLTSAGYASMSWVPGKGEATVPGGHRVILHAIGLPVPTAMVVDHLCRNRACINPDHLDVVDQRENTLRSPVALGSVNAAKTHCAQGHEFTPENTYVWVRKSPHACTTRICKTCQAVHQRNYQARRRGLETAS